MKLLGINIDNQLSFNKLISNICKFAFNQLNALSQRETENFFRIQGKKALINNFIMSNLSYCFFAWFISSTKSLNKVENVQTRALRFLHNNYIISSAQLPEKSAKAMIKIRNHRTLCLEIFKTLNNFMS